MLLAWKDEFAIDNGPIDHDHKMLIARINEMIARFNENPRPGHVLQALNGLRMHAELHFKREERIQADHDYAGLAEHAAEHRDLLAKIDRIIDDIEALPADVVIPDHKAKKAMLYHWILHHFIAIDRKLAPLFSDRENTDAGEPAVAAAKAG
jgi:hemerythrin